MGDGIIDLKRERWIGLMEKDNQDYIVEFSLLNPTQNPNILYKAHDFLGYIQLSPNADNLVWVEWQQPCMPWDNSQIFLANLSDSGELMSTRCIHGYLDKNISNISVFQPIWLNNSQIIFSEDSSGWSNVNIFYLDKNHRFYNKTERLWKIDAEISMPHWV